MDIVNIVWGKPKTTTVEELDASIAMLAMCGKLFVRSALFFFPSKISPMFIITKLRLKKTATSYSNVPKGVYALARGTEKKKLRNIEVNSHALEYDLS